MFTSVMIINILLDDGFLPVSIFWLKRFIDLHSGWSYNGRCL